MPWDVKKTNDAETDFVRARAEHWLQSHGFVSARVDVYRKIPGHSIRVRIVHSRFTDRLIEDRDRMTDGLLSDVPEEIDRDITLVLLLGPEELEADFMNAEFDNPVPAYL